MWQKINTSILNKNISCNIFSVCLNESALYFLHSIHDLEGF